MQSRLLAGLTVPSSGSQRTVGSQMLITPMDSPSGGQLSVLALPGYSLSRCPVCCLEPGSINIPLPTLLLLRFHLTEDCIKVSASCLLPSWPGFSMPSRGTCSEFAKSMVQRGLGHDSHRDYWYF